MSFSGTKVPVAPLVSTTRVLDCTDLEKARRIRRARKQLTQLENVCDEAGISVPFNRGVVEELRDKELDKFKMFLSRSTPEDILNSVAVIRTFSIK